MIRKLLSRIKQSIMLLNRSFIIDGFKIQLSKKHMLPIYQKNLCYYDRVLPVIARLSDTKASNHWVIDIGANVGDTLFSILKHTSANFLCIEPDNTFYSLLEKNVASLDDHNRKRIKCLQAFIVLDTETNIKLEKKLGTAHKVINVDEHIKNQVPSFTLKEVIKNNGIDAKSIDLIKIDVDGFDWECLISMEDILLETDAMLYWENQPDKNNQKQREGYLNLINYLINADYNYYFCFDNFGNYLASGDSDFLIEINHYLDRLNHKKTARTFYYVDVLACKMDKIVAVKQLLKEFYQT